MPQVSRHCNRGISRNRERGWWQGSEVTRQRSPSSQGAGTEQWPKYKTDTVGCLENCLRDGHDSFLSINPQIPACMCILISRTCQYFCSCILSWFLNQHSAWGLGKKHDVLLGLLRASMSVETSPKLEERTSKGTNRDLVHYSRRGRVAYHEMMPHNRGHQAPQFKAWKQT